MKKILIFPLAIICIFAVSMIYADGIQNNLSNNLLRMHIIANSDTKEDQAIKLAVRDEILKNVHSFTTVDVLQKTAEHKLNELGVDYGTKTSFERCYVPPKDYKNIHLPEGFYNCIRVVLGNGGGENWWCVAYPPLCFSEDTFGSLSGDGENQLKKALDKETLDTIVKNGDINFRFKIVEDIKKIENYFRT